MELPTSQHTPTRENQGTVSVHGSLGTGVFSVTPALYLSLMVTMDPIDVDCHNQLIGYLPAGSRSGGLSHEQPLSLPKTMVADRLKGVRRRQQSSLVLLVAQQGPRPV